MPQQVESAALPPAIPSYVLRGHSAQIHSLHFFRDNLRLISGDADGWAIIWDLIVRRPVVVWRAHANSVLGLGTWGHDRVITHGRDSKLVVWQIRLSDEHALSKTLPLEDDTLSRPPPVILHALTVHTLNFCSFAMCRDPEGDGGTRMLIATPGLQDGYITVTSFPDESRVASIPPLKGVSTGMLMTVDLVLRQSHEKHDMCLLAGYESGHVALWMQNASQKWEAFYSTKPHHQPVLSVRAAPESHPEQRWWYSSSADAIVARHPLCSPWNSADTHVMQTRHAGQQGLSVRSDDKILATAGWDGRIRVYETATLRELAVLKWHKEGCYATAFARTIPTTTESTSHSSQGGDDAGLEIVNTPKRMTVAEQRVARTKTVHLLAAGSKDGKISLWDVY